MEAIRIPFQVRSIAAAGFTGIIQCDGYKAYPAFAHTRQAIRASQSRMILKRAGETLRRLKLRRPSRNRLLDSRRMALLCSPLRGSLWLAVSLLN